MPEVIRIFIFDNIAAVTAKDKNIFIQLLIKKFLGDLCNVITDKKASAKLSNIV